MVGKEMILEPAVQQIDLYDWRATCYGVHLHASGGEDQILASLVGGQWPTIVVADGASTQESSDGNAPVVGLGGQTAALAVKSVTTWLNQKLPRAQSLSSVLKDLKHAFEFVQGWLIAAEDNGATTLLIATLWIPPSGGPCYLCYAYEGDGVMVMLSPRRVLDTITLPERLLSPQKVEHTAVLSRHGTSVEPAVGARIWEVGDILYVGSDGLSPLNSWCRDKRGETLDYFLSTNPDPDLVRAALSECPFNDDAVLGLLWTGTRNVITDR